MSKSWIENKFDMAMQRYGEIPKVFLPYNVVDCVDGIIPTLTASNL